MLRPYIPQTDTPEWVTLDSLVPHDHPLRGIAAALDFDFIRSRVAHLYGGRVGRPAFDPVVLFKLLFVGYLSGVRSERQLIREAQVNIAYRWFAGLRLSDKLPDPSTFSQNRRRRFAGTTICQDILREIVGQAVEQGLIDDSVLRADGTKWREWHPARSRSPLIRAGVAPCAYLAMLDAALDSEQP